MPQKIYAEVATNPAMVDVKSIPLIPYSDFRSAVSALLSDINNHIITYFTVPSVDGFRFFCVAGCDRTHTLRIYSHFLEKADHLELPSLTPDHFQLHIFEREIQEMYGIHFSGHPWMKPVRYPSTTIDKGLTIDDYPFYSIDSEVLHEVGVGPIHAGIIEPGYFRFICNGEKVIHLEIKLGYQHRGVEDLFLHRSKPLQQVLLSESIAGDTTIAHAVSHVMLMESLGDISVSDRLILERSIAIELERIAIHIGDTAALCTDVAYQFGQVVCEALRTTVINTTQAWCGNRFGKGLIRPGGSYYPLTEANITLIRKNLTDVRERYLQVTDRIFHLPSVLSRYEDIGIVTEQQAFLIGAVGMAARSSGLLRDIRQSHPFGGYLKDSYEPILLPGGDVWARARLRVLEVQKSTALIIRLLDLLDQDSPPGNKQPNYARHLPPDAMGISLTEGWRGEICHVAVTNSKGNICSYKVKDPSLHNWMALALAVRNQEISDFPLCNKSYNLSYCGHDL